MMNYSYCFCKSQKTTFLSTNAYTSLILGTLATATDSPPIQFRSFCILKYSIPYSETDSAGTGFTMKLLLPSSTSHQIAYGMSNSTVLCMSLSDQEEPDKIDFGSGGILNIHLELFIFEYCFKMPNTFGNGSLCSL